MTDMTAPLFVFSDKSALYKCSAREISTIRVWEANRVIDEAHVRTLEESITDPKHIQGPFTIIRYKSEDGSEEWRVLDGQHRQEVIRRYFANTSDAADFDVIYRCYNTTDHAAAVQLFKQINTVKPLIYVGSPVERLHEIVTALRRQFVHERGGASLLALIRPGANRPALNTAYLEEALQRYKLHERADIPVAAIVAHAVTVNARWRDDPLLCPAKVTHSMVARAGEYGFFLGLDPACSWLASL